MRQSLNLYLSLSPPYLWSPLQYSEAGWSPKARKCLRWRNWATDISFYHSGGLIPPRGPRFHRPETLQKQNEGYLKNDGFHIFFLSNLNFSDYVFHSSFIFMPQSLLLSFFFTISVLWALICTVKFLTNWVIFDL